MQIGWTSKSVTNHPGDNDDVRAQSSRELPYG